MKEFLLSLSLLLFVSTVNATNTEFTAGTLDIIDLTSQSGTTNWNLNDDSISGTINLGFNFDFYGETFTSGKGATNGCWTFTGYNNTCGDYTPDPLPQSGMDMTIFPLWGDWIRDSGSKMLYKTFGDTEDTDQYFVLGWYDMREYNRSSDNTFEMLLYETTNKIEFRYGDLNITQHDIVVGVQGHATNSSHAMYNANEYKVYLHHNECSSGTLHDSYDVNCVNTNWNSTSHNTALENKSVSAVFDDRYGCAANAAFTSTCTGYAAAYLAQQCDITALYSEECTGYAAAYLAQQCGITSLYSNTCPLYWQAYDDLQCNLDSQYAPSCPGYTQEESVAYYTEDTTDYGFEDDYYDDQYGYTEDDYYDDIYGFEDDTYTEAVTYSDDYYDDDPYLNMEFTDEEWYAIDLEEFGQELVNEWYGDDVSFTETGLIVWEDSPLETWDDLDVLMDEYDEFVEIYEDNYYEDEIFTEDIYQETYEETYHNEPFVDEIYEELYYEETVAYIEYENISDYNLYTSDVLLDEFIFLENINQIETYEEEEEFLEFESYEELEEWYEEEMEEEITIEEEYEEEYEEIIFEEEFEEETEEVTEEFEEEYLAEETFEEEAVEEIFEEIEEIREEERVAEETEESTEGITEERMVQEENKSGKRQEQLNVIASTIQTATNSMSGTTSGTSIYATGNTVASGGTSSSISGTIQNTTAASTGGMSTSSSPSISAQVQSAQIQTNTILEMSPSTSTMSGMSFDTGSTVGTTTTSAVDTGSVVGTTTTASVVNTSSSFSDSSSTSTSEDTSSQQDTQQDTQSIDTSTTEVVVASTDSSSDTSSTSTSSSVVESMDVEAPIIVVDAQVQDMQNEIETTISGGDMTASEADTVADQIIAQNIESQQEALEEEQQETGEYADSTTLIAYMGYVPGFDAYKQVSLPVAASWYESRDIYTYVSIQDNNTAFFGLYGESMQGMTKLINLQPNL
jgi:hypothetical protein